jgi:hypothetical protein
MNRCGEYLPIQRNSTRAGMPFYSVTPFGRRSGKKGAGGREPILNVNGSSCRFKEKLAVVQFRDQETRFLEETGFLQTKLYNCLSAPRVAVANSRRYSDGRDADQSSEIP